MPQLQVKTSTAQSIWKSPDGQREIFEVHLEHNGQQFKAKTYSRDISNIGWEGTVETYEKPGRNGSETFVKQPPKEGGFSGGGFRRGGSPKDEKAIQAMWAIGQAVALIGSGGADADMDKRVAVVHDVAIQLFSMVDMVKNDGVEPEAPKETSKDEPVPAEEVDAMVDDISKVFDV